MHAFLLATCFTNISFLLFSVMMVVLNLDVYIDNILFSLLRSFMANELFTGNF